MPPITNHQLPITRLRRLRRYPWLREMVQEVRLHPSDLILPLFVQEGERLSTPVASLPGVSRLSIDLAVNKAKEAEVAGIPAIAVFPVTPPERKDEQGSEAYNENNLICRAIRAMKENVPGVGIIADVALDPYTSHGHDGVLDASGDVDNDRTVEILCKQAVVQARAGCDIIAPSDMMDGRVGAIRAALDAAGFTHTAILAYTAKYASALYGPFRDAVGSKTIHHPPSTTHHYLDKLTYQMHPANADEALREAALDLAEGADMLMVKPALPYLDVLHRLSNATEAPVFAYQVSGEYAMIHAAAAAGMLDAKAAMLESLLAIKRAGARAILTYAALEVAGWVTTE